MQSYTACILPSVEGETYMNKEIAIICENAAETDFFTDAAHILTNSIPHKPDIIINPTMDKNRYDSVIYIFQQLPKDDCDSLNSWVGHQHIITVYGKSTDDRLQRFSKVLNHICGIPAPLEIERKFLIRYPSLQLLHNMPNCCCTQISQVYLDIPDANVRIRKRTVDGICSYIRTEKAKLSALTRVETECNINEKEYNELLQYRHPEMAIIDKDRYCLMYKGRYLEIDMFPFWSDKAYVEAELIAEEEQVELPPYLEVIKEVTTDRRYTNKALAQLLHSNMIHTLE